MKTKLLILAALLLALSPFNQAQDKPKQPDKAPEKAAESTEVKPNPDRKLPTQPEKGPGSTEYAHKSMQTSEAGEAGLHYWVYTPAEPAPKEAPVVCFVHGYGALKPDPYIEWITHIVRRGSIVIYPQYQAHGMEPPANYAPNSATAVNAALAWLKEDKTRVQPREKDFAITGHSAGGVTCGNLAADWETLKLPKPKAVMPVEPGRAFSYSSQAQKDGLIPLSEYKQIPEDCLLVCVYADSDTTVGHWCAKKIFADATAVKAENKNLVELCSCTHCAEHMIASHYAPGAPEGQHDCQDWFCFWKLFDGLTDAAFYGKNRQYALGNTEQQRFMGKCSDGVPMTELKVTLGDVKVDPDEAYLPVFDRQGRRLRGDRPDKKETPAPAPEKKPEPAKPAPKDESKEKEEGF